MELVERYLQAVKFWLPKAEQNDILAELAEDIHSQMEERETELGRALNRLPTRNERFEDILWALINSREFIFNH